LQEQRSDTGYEETGYRGLGFIFSSIRSAHFTLASKGNFAHRGVSMALAQSPLQIGAFGHRLQHCSDQSIWNPLGACGTEQRLRHGVCFSCFSLHLK